VRDREQIGKTACPRPSDLRIHQFSQENLQAGKPGRLNAIVIML
jgi:hypothetical protein